MHNYRLYFLHPVSGKIAHSALFDAPDDGQALSLACEQIGDKPLELWCKLRMVQRIDAFGARDPDTDR